MVQALNRLIELDEQETTRQKERVAFLALTGAILEALPDGLVVADTGGSIHLVNHRAQQIFGYHRSEMIGKSIEMLLPLETRDMHVHHRMYYNQYSISSSLRRMGRGFQLHGRRSDGTTFPADITLARLVVPGAVYNLALIRPRLPKDFVSGQAEASSLCKDSNRKPDV